MIGKKVLMIPGPIEFDPEVLDAMGKPTPSHVAPDFIESFGQAIEQMRQVWQSSAGQPFIITGSGTLAMDIAAANLAEPGDQALVINTGYFSDRMGTILERYGCQVEHLRTSVGDRPTTDDIKGAMEQGRYRIMAFTHVDTSTGVLADAEAWTRAGKEAGAIVIMDGVCSLAGEELRQQDWGVDVALTASQKAIGVPPGLALLIASPVAMEAFRQRTTPVANYYADWTHWLPIMEAYEARKPAYFGTPAVNLVLALRVSLGQILAEGIDARVDRHRKISQAVKSAATALGLKQVPQSNELAANTMTALYYPDGVDASLLGRVKEGGAIFAGGLHPEIKDKYFRIGHMGSSHTAEILTAISALEWGLKEVGYPYEPGVGQVAAQKVFLD